MLSQELVEEHFLFMDDETDSLTSFNEDYSPDIYFTNDFLSEISSYQIKNSSEKWNEYLLEHGVFLDEIDTYHTLTEHLESAYNQIFSNCVNDSIISSIRQAINVFEEDKSEALKNKFSDCSLDSLKQLTRYIPNLNQLDHRVYVDRDSGFFGLTLKSPKDSKPILNLLLQENGEIIFSFIERKRGITKISGRAHFSNYLEDSSQIKHLIRMVKI